MQTPLNLLHYKSTQSLPGELLQFKAQELIGLKVNQQREKESSKQPYRKQIGLLSYHFCTVSRSKGDMTR